MKVLLLNGSPNEFGSTWTALKEVERALNGEGIETEIFQIGKKPIAGCIACRKCYDNSGKCAFGDLVNVFLEKAAQSDGFVFGSPVYYSGINGSLKSFLDRVFYAGRCFQYKPSAAIVAVRRAGATAALDQMHKYFMLSKMPLISSHYWNMAYGMDGNEVKQDLEGMQTIFVLGQQMAWILKCIESAKKSGINPPQSLPRQRMNFIR
ncbi:MAG: flavodoxin family protein [Elusimicrobiota bacterium]|jgi:multimeric flavodoxin WrbA|nr:flavodoxin family protein [Elusimicrobiota bacterium]